MAKNRSERQLLQPRPLPTSEPQSSESSPQKTKAEQAREYLDKFYPGWDFYLKAAKHN